VSLKFEAKPLGPYLAALGVRDDDVVDTVSRAYDLQISDDHVNLPKYLGALEKLSNAHVPGVEALQIKVATDRSLDRYTLDDLDNAYARIGITAEHVTELQIDRDDFSNEVVLDYHRRAMDGADVAARSEIGRALGIIGKERDDPVMMRLARNGGVYLSLEQAYKEFNITDKAGLDDELLIM
jgi:ubiquitin carboxyl-terminal hydrolase 25/28